MLDEGIKGLVMQEPELQVEITTYVDPSAFFEDLSHTMPDVVVLSESSPHDRMRMTEILHGLSPQKALRMIVIRIDENIVEVYDKQSLRTVRGTDLLPLIKYR